MPQEPVLSHRVNVKVAVCKDGQRGRGALEGWLECETNKMLIEWLLAPNWLPKSPDASSTTHTDRDALSARFPHANQDKATTQKTASFLPIQAQTPLSGIDTTHVFRAPRPPQTRRTSSPEQDPSAVGSHAGSASLRRKPPDAIRGQYLGQVPGTVLVRAWVVCVCVGCVGVGV